MLETFNKGIKPLNDKLGDSLGIKTIEIKDASTKPEQVTVMVAIYGPMNCTIMAPSNRIGWYEALGLAVRRSHE